MKKPLAVLLVMVCTLVLIDVLAHAVGIYALPIMIGGFLIGYYYLKFKEARKAQSAAPSVLLSRSGR